MNLKTRLLEVHSAEVTQEIVYWIADDTKRMDQLIQLVEQDNLVISQRASWPLTYVIETHPDRCIQFQSRMFTLLKDLSKHEGVRRNIMRAFSYMQIQDDLESKLFDLASAFLSSINTSIAVKVHSMQVMYNLSIAYPELQRELLEEINKQQPFQTVGFNSRAKKLKAKILKNLGL